MDVSKPFLANGLDESEVALLKKGGVVTIADLVLTSPDVIAKRAKAFVLDVRRIVNKALDLQPTVPIVRFGELPVPEVFTTGDPLLDRALGGGINTGHIWELVGESASGKTGLALQLSLCVQLSAENGGLDASACYITTSSKLQTKRLVQIMNSRQDMTECGLENVHTMPVPNVGGLQRCLEDILPSFIEDKVKKGLKPVKLLVIDALAELFHSNETTNTHVLVERSKDLTMLSSLLHSLAIKYRLAVVVLNEVIDPFTRDLTFEGEPPPDPLSYEIQSRWFNSAESVAGAPRKDASLGLVWANQVHTRIMLSRTGRRRYVEENEYSAKRSRLDGDHQRQEAAHRDAVDEPVLIRRLSIIFSHICNPAAFDYIVTEAGMTLLQGEEEQKSTLAGHAPPLIAEQGEPPRSSTQVPASLGILPSSLPEEEELEDYWKGETIYDKLDWEELEFELTQKGW